MITHLVEVEGCTEEDAVKLKSLLKQPSDCLRAGGLVAFPTETVYGLGADALNPSAAGRIYAAKGRPSDNPLIVHISKVEDMEDLAYTNDLAYTLAQAFWPGPLTMILPKKQNVPDETTGGLDTVAIRMPAHPAALELIRQSGVYVAAPSANVSGRPSPTKASHVVEDMDGKIEYIIDGGPVGIGIESTIVDLSVAVPVILRPGFITKKMLEEMIGEIKMDAALEKPMDGIPPKAPGMKYTHYAPRGELTLVEAQRMDSDDQSREAVTIKICALAEEKRQKGFLVGIMAAEETLCHYEGKADILICVGDRKEKNTIAAGLYAALREFDAAGAEYIYAESFQGEGLSYAIMNRLLKAAGQRVIRI
ncbi:MAG: threonylcarbamoyl-AMP synthase [Lachnospiraceae bacterium]|nr:threonylcarbamoyl-AMP synthase [Lachnospiraceae bacterium]